MASYDFHKPFFFLIYIKYTLLHFSISSFNFSIFPFWLFCFHILSLLGFCTFPLNTHFHFFYICLLHSVTSPFLLFLLLLSLFALVSRPPSDLWHFNFDLLLLPLCAGSLLTRPNGRRPNQGLPSQRRREQRPLVSRPPLPPAHHFLLIHQSEPLLLIWLFLPPASFYFLLYFVIHFFLDSKEEFIILFTDHLQRPVEEITTNKMCSEETECGKRVSELKMLK